ncbi:MAG: RNase adapter RapZ [Alphaproteobacteria bacterium]|nr:RNase adapter RapZ [Alphaproteobacteria bacterium]
MPIESQPDPSQKIPAQKILVVTGISGAGKSTALQVLEDLGWEAIDNFPIRLLPDLLSKDECQVMPLAIGIDSRTRGFIPAELVARIKELDQRADLEVQTLYLDCASGEVERRYNETRRRHPMARGRPIGEGIRAERELLDPVRRWAEMVIDTTSFTSNDLQQAIRDRFSSHAPQELTITVNSFGFARGMPPLADLVFDMRFLDNPHWVDGLRAQTGLDPAMGEHIAQDPAFAPSFARIRDLVLELLPHYEAQGRAYLTIAFGCTGGRHRSVYTAEEFAAALRDAGRSPTVMHRNLTARATDATEGQAAQAG